jgi:hypothetical protein
MAMNAFESVSISIRTPGRESNPQNYSTLILKGPRKDVPLFDIGDYGEARRTARELGSLLGLPVQ